MRIIAGFDQPAASGVRTATDDANMMREHDNSADVRAACGVAPMRPSRRAVQGMVSHAEKMSETVPAPCARARIALQSKMPFMMVLFSVMAMVRESGLGNDKR